MTTTTEAPSSVEAVMALGTTTAEKPEEDTGITYEDMIEGNIQTVTISEMGKSKEVPFTDGMTIQEALEAAEVDPSGFSLRLNGATEAGAGDILQSGDTVLLAREIRGAFEGDYSLPDAIFLGESGVRLDTIIDDVPDSLPVEELELYLSNY